LPRTGRPGFDAPVFERSEEDQPDRLEVDESPPIRCRFCDAEVALESAVFGVADRAPVSTFFNPAGELMEVLTVRNAPGLRGVGASTAEFSWFPGTAWTVGACGGCGLQLGWLYRRRDGTGFAGLLTDRVRRR